MIKQTYFCKILKNVSMTVNRIYLNSAHRMRHDGDDAEPVITIMLPDED